MLEGSWVVLGRVLRTLHKVITRVSLLTSPLITTHEPPSRVVLPSSCQTEENLPKNLRQRVEGCGASGLEP